MRSGTVATVLACLRGPGVRSSVPGSRPMAGTSITFFRGTGHRYRSVLHRRDGVEVELVGGGYNTVGGPARRVPHDLAHAVVEDELGLDFGLWGVLAAGGLFAPSNTRVLSGRQPPHAGRRAKEIVDRGRERLGQAEIVVRAVADLALAGRHDDVAGFAAATGQRWALPGVTRERLATACGRLQDAGQRWDALPSGGTIDVTWRLAAPRR